MGEITILSLQMNRQGRIECSFFLRKLFPEKRIMYNAFVWGIERNLWTQNYGNGHLRETVYRKSMQLLRRKVFMIIELFSKNWLKDEFETEYKSFQIVIFLYKKGSERYFVSFTKAYCTDMESIGLIILILTSTTLNWLVILLHTLHHLWMLVSQIAAL